MCEGFKPKLSASEEMLSTNSLRRDKNKNDKLRPDSGKAYEVFKNNTTAVEVIVKEVPNKGRRKTLLHEFQDIKIKRLQGYVARQKCELNKASISLETTQKSFRVVIREIKKQLDAANHRELDSQTKNLALELENEKLKALLESKTKLVQKFKKELSNLKRILKFAIKSIFDAPEIPESLLSSNIEYDEFRNDLKKDIRNMLATKVFDGTGTFDTSMSKDTKKSNGKRV